MEAEQPTPEPTIPKHLEDMVKKAADDLGEHFDSIRIIATLHDDGTKFTGFISEGHGNFYAQESSVRDWLLTQTQRTIEKVKHENDEN